MALLAGCHSSQHVCTCHGSVVAGGEAREASLSGTVPVALSANTAEALAEIERKIAVHMENLRHVDTSAYEARRPGEIRNRSLGFIKGTQRPFDVAIVGDGYFTVAALDGRTLYTRDGHLLLGADGRLTNREGHVLQPEIVIPQNVVAVEIGTDGTVTITTEDTPDVLRDLGRIALVRFRNPDLLAPVGPTTFEAMPEAGVAIAGNPGENGFGGLQQNFLLQSNVQATQEILAVMSLTRRWKLIAHAAGIGDGIEAPVAVSTRQLEERLLVHAAEETRRQD